MSQPDLPKDPAEYRPKPLMGVGFWAMIALCVLCVLAGVLVVLAVSTALMIGGGAYGQMVLSLALSAVLLSTVEMNIASTSSR